MLYHAHGFTEDKYSALVGDRDWGYENEVGDGQIKSSGGNDEHGGRN